MKTFLLIGATIISGFFSCTKEKSDDTYWGEVTAQKNSELWSGKIRCLNNKPYNQGIDIDIDVYNSKNVRSENLFFFKYPNAEGTYLIDSTGVRIIDSLHGAVYHTLQDDGTAGDSYYIIEGIVDNWLKITKKEEDELWGEFQVAFVKDLKYGEQDPAAPDTVIFTKGNLHTRLSQ